ncbi:uroporphyrinogen decarboxylase [Microbacterium oryzae]|uniref:uroporphyrinogen decarboxylase n=1 Tax=Microbacterium oryzae TaxID=743009 RepID=UPI0025AF9343|nr:uroporphyrinogen decarboxylase [Microbacterium oryzae]MDN3310887.1 uroporphyrinogen decarboxylase [Microbacterium oryzae]
MPSLDAPLLRALRGERPETTPVWFMRQAGRSLPEYRELRVGTRMLDACLTPDLAAEITLQPVRRHGVDAGIFFSDIVVPLRLAGIDVEIVPGRGPVFADPVRTRADVERITAIDPAEVVAAAEPVREAVRTVVAELDATGTPLIGFAGAPFTLAAYLVEGGPSKEHLRARAMMHADPEAWHALAGWLAQVSRGFLRTQIEAGAAAVQLFDSWAGSLAPADFRAFVAPHSAVAVEGLEVPVIHFGVGTGPVLADMRLDGRAAAVGVDWRVPLDEAAAIVGDGTTLQGNIDPALLTAPWDVLEAHVRDVVSRGRSARAHIVNLGHGVPPETDPTVLTRIVELVHSL